MYVKKFLKLFLFLLLVAAVGQQLYRLYFVYIQQNFVDFNVYIRSVSIALAGNNIYSTPKSLINAVPFNYPPTSLLFLLMFSILPDTIAPIVFLFCSFGSLFVGMWFLCTMLFPKSETLCAFLLSSALFVQYFPTKFTLTLGQINFVILLFVIASFSLYQRHKDRLAGLFLGAATLIKIFPVFLILFFIKEKKWRIVESYIITVLCGLLLTVIVFRPAFVISYFGSISGNLFLHAGDISYFDQSLNSLLLRLHSTFIIRLIFRIIITVTSLCIFLKTKNKMLSYFGLLFSVLIFLPSFAWFHHYVILIPLILILWTKTQSKLEKFLLVFIYVLTSLHFRNPEPFPGPNILLYSHPFFGACMLWILAVKKALDT